MRLHKQGDKYITAVVYFLVKSNRVDILKRACDKGSILARAASGGLLSLVQFLIGDLQIDVNLGLDNSKSNVNQMTPLSHCLERINATGFQTSYQRAEDEEVPARNRRRFIGERRSISVGKEHKDVSGVHVAYIIGDIARAGTTKAAASPPSLGRPSLPLLSLWSFSVSTC